MAYIEIDKVNIKGIAVCVPKTSEEVTDFSAFSMKEAEKFVASTGIKRRRISTQETCTSDLCFHAAKSLLKDLRWATDDIDCIIFVTQTPDYILPATSCILQHRLALKNDVLAFDISLGCSGWVYGLMIISNLISKGSIKKGILLVGDTILKTCSKEDKSTFPLFGDAGSATGIEFDEQSKGMKFHAGTDGSGSNAIIIRDGGFRFPYSKESSTELQTDNISIRKFGQLELDGMDVFSFGINQAPESISKLMDFYDIKPELVDFFVFHQANLLMNEKIRIKLKIPAEKVPYTLNDFGNTSSASIPLTIVNRLGSILKKGNYSIIACGFGVGLSWGSVWFQTKNLVCSELIEI